MNFGTSQKQQQTRNVVTTTSVPNFSSASSTTNLSLSFPRTFTTAQNCFTNFRQSEQQQQQQQVSLQKRCKSTVAKSTLMIKNIESSTSQTDWDENEEKDKENINMLQRRDSAPDETVARLNSNQDAKGGSGSSSSSSYTPQPLLTSLNLKTQRHESVNSQSPSIASGSSIGGSVAGNANILNLSIPSSSEDITTTTSTAVTNTTSTVTANLSLSTADIANNQTTIGGNSAKQSSSSTDNSGTTYANASRDTTDTRIATGPNSKVTRTPSPSSSPARRSSTQSARNSATSTATGSSLKSAASQQIGQISTTSSGSNPVDNNKRADEDTISKSSDTSGELVRGAQSQESVVGGVEKSKSGTKLSERAKKKSWYNLLYPNYKSRSQDFKKLFKEVPTDERLIVDYSCALQRDILVQGRLYVSQNYVCFHANIFGWETHLTIKWKDVTSITKEKTALVIPNAISICTAKEKYFFATFTSRDKAFLMLFRVWQNTLMNKPMLPQEMWKWVHNCYGDELGLTTDDEDYIDPTVDPIDLETDSEFLTAIEEVNSQSSILLTSAEATSTFNRNSNTTATTSSSSNRNQSSSSSNNPNQNPNTSGNSSSGGGSGSGSGPQKSKSRSFFGSSKATNLNNSSTTASASGSDHNSGKATRSTKISMNPNAKELTLTSVSADEQPIVTPSATNGETVSRDSKRKLTKNNRQRDESLNKNIENCPTDASGSSDSDENKIPFVATAECTSAHEGRQLMHTILPINIDTLFNLLYSSKSKFLNDFHAMRKSADCEFGDWVTSPEGQKTRIVSITVQLGASVGPKTSRVTEDQVLRDCSKPGELYSIDINSTNAGIPYADSFCVLMHHCLVRTVDDHTMLSVHAQIKYKKSVWGVVKGFIEKNAWAGLEDFYTALLHSLQSETCIPPAKGKGRRPRRGTAGQVRPSDDLQTAQTNLEPIDKNQGLSIGGAHGIAQGKHANVVSDIAAGAGATGVGAGGRETKRKYVWLSICVIILISFLIVLNVILIFKLRNLEDRIEDDARYRERLPNLSNLKQLPTAPQDWIQLLREQEILHETELKKWHAVLQTAIDLLKKTEKTLAGLMFR